MGRKKKIESTENKTIKLEDNKKKNYNVSEGFYYILGLVLALVLIFATDELLSTVNYLFVVIFSIIAVIRVINFVMDKEYLKKDYSGIVMGIMCLWLALFTFKYGQFLFLELLPVLVSLLLFFMGISSLIKYFDRRVTANMIVSIISIHIEIGACEVSFVFISRFEHDAAVAADGAFPEFAEPSVRFVFLAIGFTKRVVSSLVVHISVCGVQVE